MPWIGFICGLSAPRTEDEEDDIIVATCTLIVSKITIHMNNNRVDARLAQHVDWWICISLQRDTSD